MKNINLIVISLVVVTLIFCGCTKTGPAGPTGEQGIIGMPGPQGDTGAIGPPGETGSSNIISSQWVSLSFQEKDGEWLGVIEDTMINQKAIDIGELNVFMKKEGQVYTLNYLPDDLNYTVYEVLSDTIKIHSSFDASPYKFKYTIISSGVSLK